MSNSGILKSSIARKVAMSLSALFLMLFLLQHLTINITSVMGDGSTFNWLSHFMGTNFVVQFIFQPILLVGVIFHFVMGFVLELKNRKSRDVRYVIYKGDESATWMSRNMILSGAVILAFMGLHFYDFWIPEIVHKYVETHPADAVRYYPELVAKFVSPVRTGLYVISFVFLSLHLLHGFNSAFQSLGANNKYTKGMVKFGIAFAILVPAGFVFIALFHHFNS